MQIWAILNLTPDSFFSDSRVSKENFVEQAQVALEQGADVLDIGAESTRPGGEVLLPEQEWQRLEQPLQDLKKKWGSKKFFQTISIDTRNIETAQKALELGVGIINDVSGGSQAMFEAVASYKAQIVLMHSTSLPVDPQEQTKYNDVVEDVYQFLEQQSHLATQSGVLPNKIIWDYGIGFGKNLEQNIKLLSASKKFLNSHRLLAGISRKSFLHHLLDIPNPHERLLPTVILSTYLALQGVDILRTHDVTSLIHMKKILSVLYA